MSTPIFRALGLGYAPQQILQFLQSAFPDLSPRVKRAKNAGYSLSQILNLLNVSMGGNPGDVRTESQIHSDRDKSQGNAVKGIAALGAGALAGAGITRGLPAITQTLQQNSQQGVEAASLPIGIPQGGVQPLLQDELLSPGNIKKTQPPSLVEKSQENVRSLPQQPPSLNSQPIIEQMQLGEKISNLLNRGMSPKDTADVIENHILKPGEKKWLSEQIKEGNAPSMRQMVEDFASKNQPAQQESPKKPVKGDLVASPNGVIGELESIRDQEALVKSKGKLHKVKANEIIPSPLPAKDLADLHEDLIKGIEHETGEEVSRMVNWAGYNPKTNKLSFLPHIGAMYTYGNISEEDKNFLTSVLNTRKTSGENFIGAWKEGSKSPIGAAMSAFIQRLQKERGGKGNEYEEKYETIYDATLPAKQAAEKRKDEEKKRKKKEMKK